MLEQTVVVKPGIVCYCNVMAENTSNIVGKVAHLLAVAGLAAFFFGLFGWGKTLMLAGVAVIFLSLAAYYLEELGNRKRG